MFARDQVHASASPTSDDMDAKLPPPDPNEFLGMQPAEDAFIPAPTAVFMMGRATPQADRFSDSFLDLRPGLLIVFDPA
jgi:hypothetical protein